jgi:hypothetical protein
MNWWKVREVVFLIFFVALLVVGLLALAIFHIHA